MYVWSLTQLGAKKGLGAQKVSSKSFSEVEKQAQVAEKLREEQAAEAKKQAEESMWGAQTNLSCRNTVKVALRNLIVFFLQCGINAFGV